jgi:hypothetical protein
MKAIELERYVLPGGVAGYAETGTSRRFLPSEVRTKSNSISTDNFLVTYEQTVKHLIN